MTAKDFIDKYVKTHYSNKNEGIKSIVRNVVMIGIQYHEQQVKSVDVVCSFPSKDDAVNVGYAKAKYSEYTLRRSCKELDSDTYYSGWMDCYDWMIGAKTRKNN